MRERVDVPLADHRQQGLDVDPGRLEQGLDQQALLVEQSGPIQFPLLVGGEPSDQREAIGMDSGRGQAEDHVAGFDLVSGKRLAALDGADAEARQVIIARGIHSRHFRGLAADQGAARLPTTFGDRGDHPLRDIRL